jgi:hypothetical protein
LLFFLSVVETRLLAVQTVGAVLGFFFNKGAHCPIENALKRMTGLIQLNQGSSWSVNGNKLFETDENKEIRLIRVGKELVGSGCHRSY